MVPKWLRILGRGCRNYYTAHPLCVSIEVTHSCTADCRHCDKGGRIEEKRVNVEVYVERLRELMNPPTLQISGGEPFLRDDVDDIIRTIKSTVRTPLIIFVTNGSLLSESRYAKLKDVGTDKISISLDFPDNRHDSFRKSPGLFKHLSEVIPSLAVKYGSNGIAVNTAITKENFPYLCDIVLKAEEWGIGVSFSAYTALRTGDKSLMLSYDDTKELEIVINSLLQMKSKGLKILNTPRILRGIVQYFRDGCMPNCSAGKRFVVIRPNGTLVPCSSISHKPSSSFKELKEYVSKNKCNECYVAIRAYSDRKISDFAYEIVPMIRLLSKV